MHTISPHGNMKNKSISKLRNIQVFSQKMLDICFVLLIILNVFTAIIVCKPRFILVGLPKAGTTSFHSLFTQLGLKSLHYVIESDDPSQPFIFAGKAVYDAKQHNLSLLHNIQKYDAITEINIIGPVTLTSLKL